LAKSKPFNNPFQGVKLPPKPAPKAEPKPAPKPPPVQSRSHEGLTEDDLWAMAIEGADPLKDRSAKVRPGPEPIAHVPPHLDPELEAYDELRGLVDGAVPFDLEASDEFIEGCAHGLDPRILKRLRRGEYALQAHLDLHGLSREEAKAALETFLLKSRAAGRRCVLVVTGRGLHSKDQVPVLKEAVQRWLHAARFGQVVLAFATARPHDGGAGAIYLLLRKQ
jgi:DNA-nicking Smr family endonuclease